MGLARLGSKPLELLEAPTDAGFAVGVVEKLSLASMLFPSSVDCFQLGFQAGHALY
jgi:hypothetical protein